MIPDHDFSSPGRIRIDVRSQADSDLIYAHPQHDYTRELLASIPKGWPRGGDDLDLDGATVSA